MRPASDPVACNSDGLECFAAGDARTAETLLRQAFQELPERWILVNLGLALMQQGKVNQAERCYHLALKAMNCGCAAVLPWLSAALAREHKQGWHWHGLRFEGEAFKASEWRGDSLNGQL